MSIPLSDLAPTPATHHTLSGVEFGIRPRDPEGWRDQDSGTMAFILDGVTYVAVEDPSDGYRSMLESLETTEESVTNTFPPVPVVTTYVSDGNWDGSWDGTGYKYKDSSDVLTIRHAGTNGLILAVGTDNDDDYYPSCVMFFDASALGTVESP